jgi:hypothetical protein
VPVILAILAAIGGAIWWYIRNNPRDALDTAVDMATTVANAPRRIAFLRNSKGHPVDGIEDETTAIFAIAQAFIELDGLPTAEQRQQLTLSMRKMFRLPAEDVEELEVLGRWLMTQCHDPSDAINRLARRLRKINAPRAWDHLQQIIPTLSSGDLTDKQVEAVETMRRHLAVN